MEKITPDDRPLAGASCSSLCECVGWACEDINLILDGNGHHPRCEKYAPPKIDPRHAVFGKLMWKMIQKIGGDFCDDEWSEDVLPLAEKAGLCARVEYDPEKHGEGIEAEPGDEIWWWGDDGSNGGLSPAVPPLRGDTSGAGAGSAAARGTKD